MQRRTYTVHLDTKVIATIQTWASEHESGDVQSLSIREEGSGTDLLGVDVYYDRLVPGHWPDGEEWDQLAVIEPPAAPAAASPWPDTEAERAAFGAWQAEVADGNTTLGFRDWAANQDDTDQDDGEEGAEPGHTHDDGDPSDLLAHLELEHGGPAVDSLAHAEDVHGHLHG